MKTLALTNRRWIAYFAMTFLFAVCYWIFHIVRYDLEECSGRATVERVIAVILFADWTVLLRFSVVQMLHSQRVGAYALVTALLFLLMLLLPALS